MKSSQLISLALSQLDCNQKELAKTLGVSQTQITKWKKDEHMSYGIECKIKDTLGIGNEISTELIEFAGSVKNAYRWLFMLTAIKDDVEEFGMLPYDSSLLSDEFEISVIPGILIGLKMSGFALDPMLPDQLLPAVLPDNFDLINEEELVEFYHSEEKEILKDILYAVLDLDTFYHAYISDLVFERAEIDESDDFEIQNLIPKYAVFRYIDEKLDVANNKEKERLSALFPNFSNLRDEVRIKMIDEIIELKKYAIRNSIPLEAELMNFITEPLRDLGLATENVAHGLNKTRIHPDIYMNEILESQRMLHTILPVILKKLDIDPGQFANVKLRNDI